jgi:hypothetical protein
VSAAEQIALAWQSLGYAARQMARPVLWTPWLLLGLLQAGVLIALGFTAHPWVSPVMAPLVTRLAGERALHYPDLFLALPGIYARIDIVLAALPGALVLGASTALFRDVFLARGPAARAAYDAVLRRALTLIVVNLPFHLLAVAWSTAIAVSIGGRAGLVGRAAYVLALGGSVLIQALFLYASAFVMIEGRGVRGTFASLPHAWRRGIWAALVLGLLMVLPLLPLNLLSGAGNVIARRGRPELLAAMSFAQLVIALGTGFLLSGGATLVFLGGIARRPEPGARR